MKKCTRCSIEKELTDFYRNSRSKDGLTYQCILCIKADQKRYNKENLEARLEYQRKYKKENRERIRERDRLYRMNNLEMHKEKERRYVESHPEKMFEKRKKYRLENREYFLNKARERKLKLDGVSDGTVTLDFENDTYSEQEGRCAYCQSDLNETGKHLDHIIPISRGGLHTGDNVHWVCPTCNLSKHSKLEEEWTDRPYYDLNDERGESPRKKDPQSSEPHTTV